MVLLALLSVGGTAMLTSKRKMENQQIVYSDKTNSVYSEYEAETGDYKSTLVLEVPSGYDNKRLVTRFYDEDVGMLCYLHGQAIHCERIDK